MRDVGVDGPFIVPDWKYDESHSTIHSNYGKWLLDSDLKSNRNLCTLDARRWALEQPKRMDLQDQISKTRI